MQSFGIAGGQLCVEVSQRISGIRKSRNKLLLSELQDNSQS